jgi:hypothetical protein
MHANERQVYIVYTCIEDCIPDEDAMNLKDDVGF